MPIFRLNFKNGASLGYSTDTSKFYTPDGHEINFHLDGVDALKRSSFTSYEKGAVIKKSRTPHKIRIALGNGCNFNCKYCSQKKIREAVDAAALKYVDSFLDMLRNAIDAPPKAIEFWGGEPLVYIKVLERLVPTLREWYPTTTFRMITNGSLLNRKTVDFLVKYGFVVAVSHDAMGQAIRGEDPLADPEKKALMLELFEKLKDSPHGANESTFGFATTLTKDNCDPLAVGEYLRKNFHPDVPVATGYVTAMGGISEDPDFLSVAFDEEALEQFSNNTLHALYNFVAPNAIGTIANDARDAITKLVHCDATTQIGSRCEADSAGQLIVKLNGDVLQCQNGSANGEYGNIRDMDTAIVKDTFMWKHREACLHCPFAQLCYGACPTLTGNGFVDSCRVSRAYYSAIFTFAVSQIFGDKLINIKGDIAVPVRELVETKKGKTKYVTQLDMPTGELHTLCCG